MGPALHYVAAGLFMIAAAMFTGHAINARGDSEVTAGIGAGVSGLLVVIMIIWGIIGSIRERTKDKA